MGSCGPESQKWSKFQYTGLGLTSWRSGGLNMVECFEFRDAFPPIQDVIEELCRRSGEAKHRAIVKELLKHPGGSLVIEDAVARCECRTKESMASNMVQWLSKQYTSGKLSDFETRFKRQKVDRCWAYSPR
jgi:hypothetical protein